MSGPGLGERSIVGEGEGVVVGGLFDLRLDLVLRFFDSSIFGGVAGVVVFGKLELGVS